MLPVDQRPGRATVDETWRGGARNTRSRAARQRIVKGAVEEVAAYLDNTPAVCRSAYIDPRVIDRYDSGETIRVALDRAAQGNGGFVERERIEAAVMALIS